MLPGFPPSRPRRLWRGWQALACLLPLLFAGCTFGLVYGQLHRLLPWYLDDYVTLDRDQRALLDVRLSERLDWHCRTQLEAYAELLRTLQGEVRRGTLDATRLDDHLAQAERLLRELLAAIVPDARLLLSRLDEAQVRELGATLHRRNRELREEFLSGSPAERRRARSERMEKRLRTWFGRLNAEQRALVEQWSGALQPVTAQWLANREQWRARLLAALAERRDAAGLEARLRPLLVEPDAFWSADYRARLSHNRALTLDLVATLYGGASPRQREHLLGELDDWAAQFERLACAPAPTLTAGQG